MADQDEVIELGRALLSHLDALMPAIERAIAAEWKRGNYINGPQFGAAIEAFRATLASGTPLREDPEEGLRAKHGGPTAAISGGDAQTLSTSAVKKGR